ncbi:Pyridoxine/pyridoxamine 5'-phosphate oxidase 1, chloroplastic [Gracilariopsis chorda]|uniref:NAD(P)H-hydrate epimerase n=1 Tax=Gracilariopsis chorda TaxID=448386 RepID=A0A2V3IMJ1_9FLOR|nr:Pyridoxine/pyridoxamine 5'-phosphate oxidase 1, chloroplastic [Gracilariopsis chorda]|eukprot:PXF43291.1 Pyridoxine/pyridoxamine 5'-phosphate oxidase 1, chloroplastic [Gracilariopsis chorda]
MYISAQKAAQIDALLMGDHYAFSLEQLMELAGLSVAHAAADYIRQQWQHAPPRVVVACGPGNNGGDGLVAARHLHHLGFHTCIWYPSGARSALFTALLTQARALRIGVHHTAEQVALRRCDVVLDAIFGFSFDGAAGVRQPYRRMIESINDSAAPVICVDVPSGWHVERGDVHEVAIRNARALVSLTAPKLCARRFEQRGGAHYVGGRFVPPSLCEALDFDVVRYERERVITRIA